MGVRWRGHTSPHPTHLPAAPSSWNARPPAAARPAASPAQISSKFAATMLANYALW